MSSTNQDKDDYNHQRESAPFQPKVVTFGTQIQCSLQRPESTQASRLRPNEHRAV